METVRDYVARFRKEGKINPEEEKCLLAYLVNTHYISADGAITPERKAAVNSLVDMLLNYGFRHQPTQQANPIQTEKADI